MVDYVDRATKDISNIEKSVSEVKEQGIQDKDITKIVDAVKAEVSITKDNNDDS